MDPFLGPVASASLAALGAGILLGLVRLGGLSLEMWRRWTEEPSTQPVRANAPASPSAPVGKDVLRLFRRARTGMVLLGLVAAIGLLIALTGPEIPRPPIVGAPSEPRSTSGSWPLGGLPLVLATALEYLVLGLAAAAMVVVLDRGMHALLARLGRVPAEPEQALSEMWKTARQALPGRSVGHEPPGVGLAYAAIFASGIGAFGTVLAIASGDPMPQAILFAGAAALALPASYAAAAERTTESALARRRQDAALRQLTVAPVWVLALLLLTWTDAPAILRGLALAALLPAALVALPGTTHRALMLAVPLRGDLDAPSGAVRALTDAAHYVWLAAWSLGIALLSAGPRGGTAKITGFALAVLLVFGVLRRIAAARGAA